MRCRIVGQQNADVDPDIEDFDERMPHGLFVPDAEVKCLDTEQSQLAMAANTHLRHTRIIGCARDTFDGYARPA